MALWLLLGVLAYLSFAISTSIDKLMMNKKYNRLWTNMLKSFFDAIMLLAIGLAFFSMEFTPQITLACVVLGFLYAVAGIFYFRVLGLSDVSKVMPYLQAAQVLLTFFFSLLLFSEPFNILNLAGILLIILGMYAVLSRKGFRAPRLDKAFYYVLIIVALHLGYWLLAKQVLFDAQPISVGLAMYLSGGFFLAVFYLVSKAKANASASRDALPAGLKPVHEKQKILTVAIAAVFGSMGTFLLFTALKVGFASKVYSLAALQPVFISIIALIFLREKWYLQRIIGTVLVCAGIFLISI